MSASTPAETRPSSLLQVADNVLYSQESVFALGMTEIVMLRKLATECRIGRARICAHQTPEASVQEMLIAVQRRSYIRPHKHLYKTESFHMIEGEMDVLLFSDAGTPKQIISLAPYGKSENFYYRLSEPIFHSIVLRSEIVIFQETTSGPFDRHESIGAPWAPEEDADPAQIETYRTWLNQAVVERRSDARR